MRGLMGVMKVGWNCHYQNDYIYLFPSFLRTHISSSLMNGLEMRVQFWLCARWVGVG